VQIRNLVVYNYLDQTTTDNCPRVLGEYAVSQEHQLKLDEYQPLAFYFICFFGVNIYY